MSSVDWVVVCLSRPSTLCHFFHVFLTVAGLIVPDTRCLPPGAFTQWWLYLCIFLTNDSGSFIDSCYSWLITTSALFLLFFFFFFFAKRCGRIASEKEAVAMKAGASRFTNIDDLDREMAAVEKAAGIKARYEEMQDHVKVITVSACPAIWRCALLGVQDFAPCFFFCLLRFDRSRRYIQK